MIGFDVQLDRNNLRRLRVLESFSRVAAAKALTFTAEKAVPAWVGGHRVFHKRRAWIDRGVRMRPARAGNLNAQVGTIDKYMGRHVIGVGEEKQGHNLFMPIYGSISAARTHMETRRRMRGFERTKRKPFLIHLNGGGVLIARRKGKGRTPLEILGKLQDGAQIQERLDALGIVSGVANREFGPIYERVLLKALEGRA